VVAAVVEAQEVAAAEDATKSHQIQLLLKHTKPGSKRLGSGFIVIRLYFWFLESGLAGKIIIADYTD